MSIRVMSQVWGLDLPHAEAFVLLALADFADDDGAHVYPSLARVGWKVGYSERQVRRIVRTLEDAGLLVLVNEATAQRPNEYRINVAAGTRKPPFVAQKEGGHFDPPSSGEGGHSYDRAGRTLRPGRADTATSAESSGESSVETSEGAPSRVLAHDDGGDVPDDVTDMVKWGKVRRAWRAAGYNVANVRGQVDWYANGIPAKWQAYAQPEARPAPPPDDAPRPVTCPDGCDSLKGVRCAKHEAMFAELRATIGGKIGRKAG